MSTEISKSHFYQSKADIEAEVNRDKIILDNVREIRDEDPGIGGYKLWLMLTELYGRELIHGRDSFSHCCAVIS